MCITIDSTRIGGKLTQIKLRLHFKKGWVGGSYIFFHDDPLKGFLQANSAGHRD